MLHLQLASMEAELMQSPQADHIPEGRQSAREAKQGTELMQCCSRQAGGLPGAWPTFRVSGRFCAGAAFGLVADAGEAVFWITSPIRLLPNSAESLAAAYESCLPEQSHLQ